ncbi:hypothetical protein ASNO1_17050 [Corallococcus caeni]|uniref:Adenosine deaminase domain-containing protein n=2 Tax=Corallococcus caeni TaxID=3082388 RepID=A0ABQ6QNP6_9BACT|nr:hypothetical protein ASNO1_17050 [Corallococcus sp. NO1]
MHSGQGQALGAVTPRSIPEAYMRAEVASFPLTSEKAFHEGLITLEPELGFRKDGQQTADLWRECEQRLSEHASGWSLDRLVALRDEFWFARSSEDRGRRGLHRVPMARYLRALAEAHLERRPGVTDIARSTNVDAVDALTHYRWLVFAMPEDLLLSAVREEPPPLRVNIDPPLLIRQLLDQGVAEIHHHIGAGMDFPLLWAALLSAVGSPALEYAMLRGPGIPFDNGALFLRWLLAAAVARCVLAEFLLRGGNKSLPEFVQELMGGSAWSLQRRRVLARTLKALASGAAGRLPDLEPLRGLYADLHPLSVQNEAEPPLSIEEVWRRCDPIAVRLRLKSPNGGERWLVRHGLARLYAAASAQATPEDDGFARLFWQVMRIRCLTYRSLVQRPMTAGLLWFIRFSGRLHLARGPLRAVRAEVSYDVAGGDQPIAALEARTGSKESAALLAEELWALTYSWRRVLEKTRGGDNAGRPPEFGVVVLLKKQRDPSHAWEHGRPLAYGMETYAEPHPAHLPRLGGRFADYFVEQSAHVRSLVDVLRTVPHMPWLVRGLDVAADELSVPTWVLAPLYRAVRRGAACAAVTSGARAAPPLRMTAHVGEDFRHLLEGLRRIYECTQYLLDRTGGRLGHAIALGLDPQQWAESVGAVMMPAEDRLWDLVFEWRLYSQYRMPPELRAEAPPSRTPKVENDIQDLSELVFGRAFPPAALAEAHHVLHQLWCWPLGREDRDLGLDTFTRALRRLRWHEVHHAPLVHHLLQHYREDEAVFRRGQHLVDIALDTSEVQALRAVQNGLRRCVSARGIVVEVNPSSNLLIGNLLDLRNHPILRLFPPQAEEGAPPPVPIAVGADDPVTFSTYLLREYSLLYEAAMGAGYPERDVHAWLNRIRQTSMDARFTTPWRPDALKMADDLLKALETYLWKPFQRAR